MVGTCTKKGADSTDQKNNPITQSTVSKIGSKFRETGDVKVLPKSGRPKIAQDKKIDIVLSMEENPQSTSTLVAPENKLVQELNEDYPDRRLQLCETMMNLCQTNPNLHQQILFSNEATFCLNGTVNRQNCRCWSWMNPHWIIEAHTQHPQKLNCLVHYIRMYFVPVLHTASLTLSRARAMPRIAQWYAIPIPVVAGTRETLMEFYTRARKHSET
ncbi:hypothetical protein NQ318_016741 [Aromia moschata]|uniref:Uncharacterized protein n=1 Tax=Aromia moschata TaxID=1265417 RepID=A0AAV8XV53_9CUCU|nr:hypothetical protein NQ318_016741 [Aromia moschata]